MRRHLYFLLFAIGASAQDPGLGITSGSFQCFRGWYMPLENPGGALTGTTWNLGEGNHDEGTVCGGFGGLCPSGAASDMREADAQRLVLATEASHFALTAYEIHDHSRTCAPLEFCVQPLSYVYFKTRAAWQILWRYTGDLVNDRICVRTQYPGYVFVQGVTVNTQNHDVFRTGPLPDVVKLMDHMSDMDNKTNGYVGCFTFNATQGFFKQSCPMLNTVKWSNFGLDGIYVRTDYPDWIFLQGMSYVPSGRLAQFHSLAFDIPRLLTQCNNTQNCVIVDHQGRMDDFVGQSSFITYERSNVLPQLTGLWIKKSYVQNVMHGLNLEPQPTSF